jgi:protein translocase SecG subunit
MLHNLWIISSLILILFIIIQNPKSQGLGTQSSIFGITRTAEENVTKITWFLTCVFFTLAIYISASNN